MYSRKDKVEQANQLDIIPGCERLDKMEEALQQITEQMAVTAWSSQKSQL